MSQASGGSGVHPDEAGLQNGPPTKAPHEITSHILALIQLLSIRATQASEQIRRELGIGATEFRILSMLAVEPRSSGTRIAEIIGRDEAAVSRSVTALIAKRMIEDAGGRGRARRLVLTALGAEVQDKAWRSARERERRLMAPFSLPEQQHLLETLKRLLDAITDEVRADTPGALRPTSGRDRSPATPPQED